VAGSEIRKSESDTAGNSGTIKLIKCRTMGNEE
jgi:hypothetical protein